MNDVVIAALPKNSKEEIRIGLSRYEGHDLVAVRVYFKPSDGGDMCPGKSGINVRVAMLPDIIEALQKAEAEARQRGLL